MASHGLLTIQAYFPRKSQTDLNNIVSANSKPTGSGRELRNAIASLLSGGAYGGGGVGITAVAGSLTSVAASSSFTCTAANSTVGDKLIISGPDGDVTLTAVAANTENPLLGQYSVGGGTDANLATSIRLAINANPAAKKYCTAAGSTNTVALTAVPDGAYGNNIKLIKQVTTSGVFSFTSGVAFTGGISPNTAQTCTITVGTNPANNNTLGFGNVTITWKTSGSGENQVTIGGTTTLTATALKNAINAHSILGGLFVATSATNVVTLTVNVPTLVHYMTYIVSSTGNVTVSGQFTAGCTPAQSATIAATSGVF